MKNFKVTGKVWVWPGDSGWNFVYVDKNNVEKIRKNAKPHKMGFVKVRAKIGKTEWDTSLFPYKREDTFLIAIKKAVRNKEDIWEGDTVKIKLTLI